MKKINRISERDRMKNKLKDQNEFLKDFIEALEDVKHGRVSEFKPENHN